MRAARLVSARVRGGLQIALMQSLALAATVAHAQGSIPHTSPAASEHYEDLVHEAVREYDAGNYVEARTLFERAHAIKASARTLRGLGICSYELKHYVEAADELKAALLDTRNPLTGTQRADVENTLAKAGRFIGKIAFDRAPDDAAIQVDGRPIEAPEVTLEVGDHVVVASAPGYHEQEQTVTVEGTRTVTVPLHLLRLSPSSSAAAQKNDSFLATATSTRNDTSADGNVLSKWWFWTAIGVVAAGTTIGIVLASRPHDTTAAANKGSAGIALASF